MFYYLYQLYGDQVGWFRIFQYTSFRTVMAALNALLMGVFLAPWFIRKLKERQIGQIVREDGPASHLNKRGTPTMGGSLILFCLVIPTLLWGVLDNPYVWMVLTTTVGYGIIGFYDDYRKVSKKSSAGLAGRFKLLGQFGIAALVVGLLIWKFNFSTELAFPFARFDLYHLALPDYIFFVLGVLVIVGASNAVNLTDGLDGLAIVPVTINASTFLVLAYAAGGSLALTFNDQIVRFTFAEYLRLPYVPGAQELAVFCSALIGAGAAFLWYNAFPAQIFMGDVGSLALGGALGTLAVCTKNELLLVIIGGVFVAETISVMLQVSYFKHTKKKYGQGRRIFLMAPLHHHFEKQGWHESKVSVRFWIVSTILALIALSSLKLR